jgi:hypothetical protein
VLNNTQFVCVVLCPHLGHDGCLVLIFSQVLPGIFCCNLQAAAVTGIGEQHTPLPAEYNPRTTNVSKMQQLW